MAHLAHKMVDKGPNPPNQEQAGRKTFFWSGIFALLYVSIPWPEIYNNIYGFPFTDRANYQRKIETGDLRSDYFLYDSWLSYITDEFLWSELLKTLTRDVGIDAEVVFLAISFYVIFVFAYIVSSRYNPLALILLLNPLVVDFAFSQLRLALAIAILGTLYMLKVKNKAALVLICVLCSMIHTTVPLFVFIYLLVHYVSRMRHLSDAGVKAVLVTGGLLFALALGPLRDFVFGWTGDRRLTYGADVQSSALYLSVWILLFVALLLVDIKSTGGKFEVGFSIVLLTIVVSTLLFPGYPTRFLAATYPILVIAIVTVSQKFYGLPLIMYMIYSLFQWVYWFNLG
jgi:hypothetical protein